MSFSELVFNNLEYIVVVGGGVGVVYYFANYGKKRKNIAIVF